MALMDDAQYRMWKTQLLPIIYDWFANHHLDWPTQALRWGQKLEDSKFKTKHRLYWSDQTESGRNEPCKVIIGEVDLPKPRVAATEAVATWSDYTRATTVRDKKVFVHPGEVNKIRELPQDPQVIVTHTDAPQLYVWATAAMPNQSTWALGRGQKKVWPEPPAPSLTLTGHTDDAQFALATSSAAPWVASGGKDLAVLLWCLDDHITGLGASPPAGGDPPATGTQLANRVKFQGHTNTVEDVAFKPGSFNEVVSVGDDQRIMFWDARAGAAARAKVTSAHDKRHDIHCVDWAAPRDHLVATGAADGSVKVWDTRRLAEGLGPKGALHTFTTHTAATLRVEWHPTQAGYLASGGEDQLVLVWSLDRPRSEEAKPAGASSAGGGGAAAKDGRQQPKPAELVFQHVGHRQGKVVDFQWCPGDAWTLASVSDNNTDGTLQVWRISDLLTRPEEEVLAELQTHKEWILNGKEPPRPTPHAEPRAASTPPPAVADGDAASAAVAGAGGGADAAEGAAGGEAGPAGEAVKQEAEGAVGGTAGEPQAMEQAEGGEAPAAEADAPTPMEAEGPAVVEEAAHV